MTDATRKQRSGHTWLVYLLMCPILSGIASFRLGVLGGGCGNGSDGALRMQSSVRRVSDDDDPDSPSYYAGSSSSLSSSLPPPPRREDDAKLNAAIRSRLKIDDPENDRRSIQRTNLPYDCGESWFRVCRPQSMVSYSTRGSLPNNWPLVFILCSQGLYSFTIYRGEFGWLCGRARGWGVGDDHINLCVME